MEIGAEGCEEKNKAFMCKSTALCNFTRFKNFLSAPQRIIQIMRRPPSKETFKILRFIFICSNIFFQDYKLYFSLSRYPYIAYELDVVSIATQKYVHPDLMSNFFPRLVYG